jgi:uroporphyrinogen-III synthase
MGFVPVLSPSLSIAPRALRLPTARRWQAVVVTSGNALAALPESLRSTPLLAVGDATAARARAAGFWRVSSAGRDAAALVALVPLCCAPARGPLLLPTGARQGLTLAAALRERGFRVVRRIAYAATPAGCLRPEAWSALREGRLGAALFFSPDSARAFISACPADASVRGVRAVAISPATAAALAPLRWADIRVASRPNQDELLSCLT